MQVVTISSSYGAGGSVIAPLVAERLGVSYLARAVAARDSQRIESEAREAAYTEEELERGLWQRMLNALAATPAPIELGGGTETTEHPDRALRAQAEQRLGEFAASGEGGVVLGWAAALVLPGAYRVRLDGPAERRLRRGAEIEGIDEDAARQRLERTDEVRRLYWRRLYQCDWRDPDHFHLWIDTTALSVETSVSLIVDASRG